ncbi:terpene cyclase/mutase family protein [Aspergillus undulatus]|uniref:terpene cyclase/mutase family protein n=1 Tax=Aspergillus undulatus TaxID=1810928 RepID=UPI003CCDAEAD
MTLASNLPSQADKAIKLATEWALSKVHADGHWCGELKSNVTITAEYIFLRQALGMDLTADSQAYIRHILSRQNSDGSWGLAPEYPGDVSTTTEAYLALKILGTNMAIPEMQRARNFILEVGGVARVRVFTRIFLATFGLFPWDAVPELPVELILLPSVSPINIYRFASWARGTIAPLLIICHHRPIYALPNGRSATNDYLDELWVEAAVKSVPYCPGLWDMASRGETTELAFSIVDKLLYYLNGLRSVPLLRSYARRRCIEWILERQETTGDWAGIFPPMHASVFAFVLEGYDLDDEPVRLGIQALENFAWEDEDGGKRIQACVSPVWDTALMSIGLCDTRSLSPHDDTLNRALSWIRDRQLLHPRGDWRVYRPNLAPGGFSFEYQNTWYPDVDDTAAVILAQLKCDPQLIHSESVLAAASWIIGMQNPDGGWAAFDVENDKLWLNKIPFSDMDSLCDESCPDITGRILEAFGLMIRIASETASPEGDPIPALRAACMRGIGYLASTQQGGSWFGRWGCNRIYGTSHALCGLSYFVSAGNEEDSRVDELVRPAVQWTKRQQNPDGGWGESLLSYKLEGEGTAGDKKRQESTASQTAWALMGLLAHLPISDVFIQRGIRYLVSSQALDGSWHEEPETVPTDLIVPVRSWDDMRHIRSFTFDFTYRFDDVLDPSKLESSLGRLLEIGNWRQLGARLRRNRSGQLEYHIPAQYSDARRAFHFSSIEYGMSIQEHALGSRIPQAGVFNDECSLYSSPNELGPLVRHPSAPRSIEDYIHSDIPQLHIHVVLFHDATLLTITHLHTLFDGLSRAMFFKAWASVLNGRDQDVPSFVQFESDPLGAIGTGEPKGENLAQGYTQYRHLITGLGLVIFGVRLLWDLLWHWKEEEHTIRLPGRCVDRMHQAAMLELKITKDTKNSDSILFLSKSDVILAWWIRTMTKALNPPAARTIMIMNVFHILSILPTNTVSPQDAVLSGNAIFYAYTLLSARQVLENQSLTQIGSKIRQSITSHRTMDQVQAMAAIQRSSFLRTPFLIGPPDIQYLSCTNFYAARPFELDISAAVSRSSTSKKRATARGQPSYLNCRYFCNAYPTRNLLRVIGKDAAGDWWLILKARAGVWPVIRSELRVAVGQQEGSM